MPVQALFDLSMLKSFVAFGIVAKLISRRGLTIWKRDLLKARSSACPPLPLKGMPTVHRIRSRALMRRNSPADMSTGPSRAALNTICRRKRRKLLPKRSSTSPGA
jgi:hypothetical protein